MAFNLGNNLASLTVRIGADTAPLRKALKGVERDFASLQANLKKVGSIGTKFVTLPIIGIGIASLKSAADIEKLQLALTSAMGSAEAAAEEMRKLEKAAKNPGLGFEQAVRGSVRLQAVGFSAEEARGALLQFGNAIARAGGSASDLDGVALALTQIASKGKVSAEEINQIAERVPQVRAAMQGAFGTASSEMIQKLGIEAKDFVRGLVDELSTLERAQGGLANTFENIQQTISKSMGKIGLAIDEAFDLQGIAEKVGASLEKVTAAFVGLDASTQKLFLSFAGIAAAVFPAGLALAALMTPIGLIAAGLAALAGAAALFYFKWEEIWLNAEAVVFAKASKIIKATQFIAAALASVGFVSADAAGRAAGELAKLQKMWAESIVSRIDIETGGLDAVVDKLAEMRQQASEVLEGLQASLSGVNTVARNAAEALSTMPIVGPDNEGLMMRAQEGLAGIKMQIQGIRDVAQMAAPALSAMTGIMVDQTTRAVDQMAFAVGNVAGGFGTLGQEVKRVMRSIIADIAAAIAKLLFFRALLVFGGGIPVGALGGYGGVIGSGIRTVGHAGGASYRMAQPSGLTSEGVRPVVYLNGNLRVSAGELQFMLDENQR